MSSNNICSALMRREMTGTFAHNNRLLRRLVKNKKPELPSSNKSKGSCSSTSQSYHSRDIPQQNQNQTISNNEMLNLRINIEQAIPKYSLQLGHVVMGFTHCNRFLLSYTIKQLVPHHHRNMNRGRRNPQEDRIPEEFDTDTLYTYKLYFWLFVPYKLCKKYASVLLFDRNGIPSDNLLMQIAQWKFHGHDNDKFIVITGRNSNPEDNPRCYLTLTAIPRVSAKYNCRKCKFYPTATEYKSLLTRCNAHSLTLSSTYELVSPFPQFDPEVSIYLTEDHRTPTILINTGNMFHQIQLNPQQSQTRSKCNLLKTDVNSNLPYYLNYYYNRLLVLPPTTKECRRFFKRDNRRMQNPIDINRLRKPDVYDLLFNDEDDGKIDKNYRLYRNRQLADKKYEFVDDYVLRPLHASNFSNKRSLGIGSSKMQMQQKSKTVYVKKCIAKVIRSYVISCDESVSTTTEIEDNEYNFNEYPVALPTSIFTDQSQLSMIPNYKAVEKKIIVTQTSLDIEILSNEVASIICTKESMHFVFLIDFDSVVLQTHPQDCSITALVILLIQASKEQENDSERKMYETNYILQWNPSTQSAKVQFKGKLKQASQLPSDQVWNPTKKLGVVEARLYRQCNPHLNNRMVVNDWISLDELKDWYGIVTIFHAGGVFQHEHDDASIEDEDDAISLLSDEF